jgi:hypothetical protein
MQPNIDDIDPYQTNRVRTVGAVSQQLVFGLARG